MPLRPDGVAAGLPGAIAVIPEPLPTARRCCRLSEANALLLRVVGAVYPSIYLYLYLLCLYLCFSLFFLALSIRLPLSLFLSFYIYIRGSKGKGEYYCYR